MKMNVISYSLTGNNDRLAHSLAELLGAEHVRITELKERTIKRTAFDMLFNRNPEVEYHGNMERHNGAVIFVGPVWMGGVASPFRDCFKKLRKPGGPYAFVSISGGADGPNPKLAGELKKRLRREPAAVVDMHIVDLLPAEPKPTRDDTGNYQITEEEGRALAKRAAASLGEILQVGPTAGEGQSEGGHHVFR
ncbi:MAG: flavodoxin family protein [Spirochaetales bacterium]|nr:flavodoxin family protein [Spirochaetales bacterium]